MSSTVAKRTDGLVTIDDPILNDEKLWQVVSSGDLKGLTPKQKSDYYLYRCRVEGLNPASQPFQYMMMQGKEILYAGKTAADQLRKLHGISVTSVQCRDDGEIIECEVRVRAPDGREDFEVGTVWVGTAKGVERANAKMKCLTKAKRRATYSICGTGVMDETEVETIVRHAGTITDPDPAPPMGEVRVMNVATQADAVDEDTGEIVSREALTANIKALRERLGWSARDVIDQAKREDFDLHTIEGLQAMAALLGRYNDIEDTADEDQQQAILEAEYVERGQAGNDAHTR